MGLDLKTGTMQAQMTGLPNSVKSQAEALATAIQNQQGLSQINTGQIMDAYPMPSSLTTTFSSNNGGGAGTVSMYAFNNSFLTDNPTNNGSGAASVSTTYGDGFSGRVYEQYAKTANMTKGLLITGLTIIATNYTTGAQTSVPFNSINMSLLVQNGFGQTLPFPIRLNEAVRNTQYQTGILTPMVPFYVNCLSQVQLSLPANTIYAITWFTNASTFAG